MNSKSNLYAWKQIYGLISTSIFFINGQSPFFLMTNCPYITWFWTGHKNWKGLHLKWMSQNIYSQICPFYSLGVPELELLFSCKLHSSERTIYFDSYLKTNKKMGHSGKTVLLSLMNEPSKTEMFILMSILKKIGYWDWDWLLRWQFIMYISCFLCFSFIVFDMVKWLISKVCCCLSYTHR